VDYKSCFGFAVESRKRLNSEPFLLRDSEKGGGLQDLHLHAHGSVAASLATRRSGALRHPPALGEVNERGLRAGAKRRNAAVCQRCSIVLWDSTVFDVAEAEGESVVEPDGVADNRWREP
jgi:hypothetical protein